MRNTLETSTIAALSGLANVDPTKARELIDLVGVVADDFTGPHARIWAVVESMIRDNRAPDFFAVEAKCGKHVPRQLLVDALVSGDTSNPLERLQGVRENGKRRRLVETLMAVCRTAQDGSRSFSDAIAESRKALEHVEQAKTTSETMQKAVGDFADLLADVNEGRRQPVLETGIEALDAVIGGLQPTLTVIGALPGVGKSGLLAGILRNLSRRGVKVGMFSLEDERSWLIKRLTAEASGVPLFVLQNKPLTTFQQQTVGESMERLFNDMAHVVVDDRPALSAADVVSSAREMMMRHGVKALLVDHLGEIRVSRTERHDLDIAEVLQDLRSLAKQHGVPVVVACHLKRRDGLTARDEPKLTDFAFSAGVERMSRVALALSKPNEETLKVHVLKQTNGVAGVAVELAFTGPAGVVSNRDASGTKARVEALYRDVPHER